MKAPVLQRSYPDRGSAVDKDLRQRIPDLVLLVPALALASMVVWALLGRWDHPFDLEWMEGGMLAHAWRIQHGLPVYMEPDETWIPYIYPPGYPAVVAAVGQVFGLSMGVGRLVSLAGTIAACAALFEIGRRYREPVLGLLGVCAYLLCFPHSGGFYDLVRPDALGLGLFSWSIVASLGGPRSRMVAGLLLAAAFTVKHNYAAYGVPIALGIWATHGWRDALRFSVVSAVPAVLFVALMQLATGGHFLTTILGIAGAHPIVYTRWFPGGVEEVGRHVLGLLFATVVAFVSLAAQRYGRGPVIGALLAAPITLAIGVNVEGSKNMAAPPWMVEWAAWVLLGAAAGAILGGAFAWIGAARRGEHPDGRWVHGVGIALVAFLTAGLMRAHHGGFLNVWMPLHWVMCMAFVVGATAVRRRFPQPVELLMLAGLAGHLYAGSDFEPERYRPQPEDLAAGQLFVDALEDCEGPILSPYAAWLPVLAGHEPSWHLIALWDIAHKDGPYRSSVADVKRAASQGFWGCVVTATGRSVGFGIPANYRAVVTPRLDRRPAGWVGPPPLTPKTGWRVRPKSILVPNSAQRR